MVVVMADHLAGDSGNQETQRELVEIAQQRPGVREAVETFEKVAPYAGFVIETTTTVSSFAAGGNQR